MGTEAFAARTGNSEENARATRAALRFVIVGAPGTGRVHGCGAGNRPVLVSPGKSTSADRRVHESTERAAALPVGGFRPCDARVPRPRMGRPGPRRSLA